MNTTQRQIVDVLSFGQRGAADILAALRVQGFEASIDELYVDLVAMEAAGLARIQPVYRNDRHIGTDWALGSRLAPRVPDCTPEITGFAARAVDRLAQAISSPGSGVLIHRCLE